MSNSISGTSLISQVLKLPHAYATIIELTGFCLLINILALALPILLMQVYDRIIVFHSKETLAVLVIGCSAAIFLECLFRYCREAASAWAGSRFEFHTGNRIIDGVLRKPMDQFEKNSVSDHMELHGAVSTLRTFYTGQFVQSLMDFPFAVIYLFALWYLGGTLVILPVVVALLFFLSIFLLKTHFEKNQEDLLIEENERSGFLIGILDRIATIKALTLEEQILRSAVRLQVRSSVTRLGMGRISLLPTTIGGLASQIVLFGLILIGSVHVLDSTMTMGVLTACTMFGSRAIQPLQNIAQLWLRYSEAATAGKRIEKVWQTETDKGSVRPEFPKQLSGRVEIRNLKIAPQGREAEISINEFTVNARSLAIINVPSHKGISRLLMTINGSYTIGSGEVFLDEYSYADWDTHDMRGKTSFVPQRPMLFNGTVLENITMFKTSSEPLALDAAALLKLSGEIAVMPLGFETKVDSRGGASLPAGIVQRIAIARSIVTRPVVLLLDHPEAAMSEQTRQIFTEFLKMLKGSCTIICATELTALNSFADTLWKLENDHLVRQPC